MAWKRFTETGGPQWGRRDTSPIDKLFKAIRLQNLDQVQWLMGRGVSPDAIDEWQVPALTRAAGGR